MKTAEEILRQNMGVWSTIDFETALESIKEYSNSKLDQAAEHARHQSVIINGQYGSDLVKNSVLLLKD